jgi:hypothetical protein
MAGGLLNLIAVGQANVIVHGTMDAKTLFRVSYKKITNFGMQRFRLDYEGTKSINLTTPSMFTFKIKRYGDLLHDTYLAFDLPNIYSPIYSPSAETNYQWSAYDFRWIDHIGIRAISQIEITCGSTLLQRYSGDYLQAMVERDFSAEKKELFDRMSGHVPEINDPANAFGRVNAYPSAYYTTNSTGAEPSIRGRTLYIPINTWFTLDARCAFPLVSLQYNELVITVTLRPVNELFRVRDVFDTANRYPYIQPDFNQEQFQMYRFLQTPPAVRIDTQANAYANQLRLWNPNVQMLATYIFLSNEEQQLFAREDQVYLIKDVNTYRFLNVVGSSRLKLENSSGMVASWMWYMQRNDVNLRNEWSNYTNWPYASLPSNAQMAPVTLPTGSGPIVVDGNLTLETGPLLQPMEHHNSGLYISGDFASDNRKEILETMGILFEGEYRENILTRGVYDYIEKYTRTDGNATDGLYCYNFCLHTAPTEYQCSGAINLSKFKNIELEVTTYVPQIDPANATFSVICDGTGAPVAVSNKPSWQLYQYNYNLVMFEERYNILSFIGGNAGMMYAR